MGRRSGKRDAKQSPATDDFLDLLIMLPMWVGPVAAAMAFALFRWVVPLGLSLASGGAKLGESMTALPTIAVFSVQAAPWAAGLVLVAWIFAEIKKRQNRARLDRQTGPQSIAGLDWREFEELLAEAFRRQGFRVEHRTSSGPPTPDGGVDLRLEKAGARTLVQCKHWKTRQVGVVIIRELLGVMSHERASGVTGGIVVTSGGFTQEAEQFAAESPIRLIGGEELTQLIRSVQSPPKKHAAGANSPTPPAPPAPAPPVPPAPHTHREPPAPPASPAPPAPPTTPSSAGPAAERSAPVCPACGAEMIRRVARKGGNAGTAFLGCSRYPACRGTRELPQGG